MELKNNKSSECPVCSIYFPYDKIEFHVIQCLKQAEIPKTQEKTFDIFSRPTKKAKISDEKTSVTASTSQSSPADGSRKSISWNPQSDIKENDLKPLAEIMRPQNFADYFGQQTLSSGSVLRNLLDNNNIPSMILWGPPGCGKTSLAHIIANKCSTLKETYRFVKMSATGSGINDVKQVFKEALSFLTKFKRKTVLFMDEIHRFNKLQQDSFLPHVENGTIVLIGATTENPSFSLNNALLSRCRVIVLEKLSTQSLMKILERSLKHFKAILMKSNFKDDEIKKMAGNLDFEPELAIKEESLKWIAEICDGDARIALNSLELALKYSRTDGEGIKLVELETIKEGIKKSHILYDKTGDQHYDIISALHKSIRASDENASLYWLTRMIVSGEDPRFICRRLIRAASEDIGLADPQALILATSTLQAVQLIGMPESDCILAQLAVYLARAPKSREAYDAFKKCQGLIKSQKGSQPAVPLHLRNAPTKLMSDLGYGAGYNMLHKDESGLNYMPSELEDVDFFSD